MVDQWFFAWGDSEFGPFTADELRALAASGRLQPSDTVWNIGMQTRVSAARVKNLFAAPPEPAPTIEDVVETAPAAATPEPDTSVTTPVVKTVAAPRPVANIPVKKKGLAKAGPGAVIVSQDGQRVQYKKKCTKCGLEDTSRNSMQIQNGVTRAVFFCPKCKKAQPVEIHGSIR